MAEGSTVVFTYNELLCEVELMREGPKGKAGTSDCTGIARCAPQLLLIDFWWVE